jgi:quinolinate synthase
MKKTTLASILQVLQAPRPDQAVQIPAKDIDGARRSLERMFELTEAK